MQLFCVSDVHSYLEPLKRALDKAGFDPNNPNHYLISCGDLFDRGPDSEELLHYIMSLERKILVKGNHDLLLEDCCMREFTYSYDISNGTTRTICDLGDEGMGHTFDKCCKRTWNRTTAYRDLLVNYFETKKYIFCHSWLPLKCLDDHPKHYLRDRKFEYDPNWRNASEADWEQAMWGNPFELAEQGLNQTGKVLVAGHWHCSTGWAKKENRSEFGDNAKWDIYYDEKNKFISIDKCTAYTGACNIFVVEDDFLDE